MSDLRTVKPKKLTTNSLLKAANLQPGEYLFAFWQKATTGGMTSADITTKTEAKLEYILRMTKAYGCTNLGFVVSSTPGRPINPETRDQVVVIGFFGAERRPR